MVVNERSTGTHLPRCRRRERGGGLWGSVLEAGPREPSDEVAGPAGVLFAEVDCRDPSEGCAAVDAGGPADLVVGEASQRRDAQGLWRLAHVLYSARTLGTLVVSNGDTLTI